MSADVIQMVTDWNTEHAVATVELEALEATLKADYNKYVDSLAAYVARLQAANEVRQGFIRVLDQEDVANDNHHLKGGFGHSAEATIENQAVKYLIDRWLNEQNTTSVIWVKSCDAVKLLERKVI